MMGFSVEPQGSVSTSMYTDTQGNNSNCHVQQAYTWGLSNSMRSFGAGGLWSNAGRTDMQDNDLNCVTVPTILCLSE